MKKRNLRKYMTAILMTGMLASSSLTALAGQPNTGINGGQFTDFNTLTWTANDGTETTYGRGPVFSDVHPEITDPEYYLKEYFIYPGEAEFSVNSQGMVKQNPTADSLEKLREFVYSFDWIHSDELTRAEQVYNRIALGSNGNTYDSNGVSGYEGGYRVLRMGIGICENFSNEYSDMAKFVGLECEVYQPSSSHQACLIRINGQWFSLDPTSGTPINSNNTTFPVDYETEKNRYARESNAKWEKYKTENPDSWAVKIKEMDRQLAAGEITDQQYDEMYTALITRN